MKIKQTLMLSAVVLALASTFAPAYALQQELSPDAGQSGITITANNDGDPGEYFEITEGNRRVIYAKTGEVTEIANSHDVVINYNDDDAGTGAFKLQRGNGDDVMTSTSAGVVTFNYGINTNGLNNGGDGITNIGAITGLTTLTGAGNVNMSSGGNSVFNFNTTDNNTNSMVFQNNGTNLLTLDGLNEITAHGTFNAQNGMQAVSANSQLGMTVNNSFATMEYVNNATHIISGVSSTGVAQGYADADVSNVAMVNADGVRLRYENYNTSIANEVIIGDTQSATIGLNTFSYGTTVQGGMLIEGDLGVNGSIYSLNPNANSGINVANNGMDISGSENRVTLVADSNTDPFDGRGEITLREDSASFLVHNAQTGNAHGIEIGQEKTVLSGGTTSTTMTLDDNGATFANTTTGGPARVMGVADGVNAYDAVNKRQLDKVGKVANAGIASVAAMANIPAPAANQRFSVGLGYGNYQSENAFALGGVARVHDNVTVKASFGRSNEANTVGAGVGFSW